MLTIWQQQSMFPICGKHNLLPTFAIAEKNISWVVLMTCYNMWI